MNAAESQSSATASPRGGGMRIVCIVSGLSLLAVGAGLWFLDSGSMALGLGMGLLAGFSLSTGLDG